MSHAKTKKKNDKNDHQPFEFCEVCKSNHNQGRRHNFFPTHKTSLSTLLARFQSKLSDVKLFLKTPITARPDHAHQNRLWCLFCNCDITELDSPFACGNTIQHLASVEHWKRVKGFMWKHGGGMNRVDLFRISDVDYAKWEKNCKTLKTEEASKPAPMGPVVGPSKKKRKLRYPAQTLVLRHITCLGAYKFNMLSISQVTWIISIARILLQGNPHLMVIYLLVSQQVCSGVKIANGDNISPGLMKLTQISSTPKQDIQGNVHTGAPPPWIDAAFTPKESDLISSKARKPSKLNPKRVGAAWAERRKLELESERRGELVNNNNYDANWLPNFGRVWQSGTRNESRKEFKMESTASPKANDEKSEMLMPLQPYISKRMRRETSG